MFFSLFLLSTLHVSYVTVFSCVFTVCVRMNEHALPLSALSLSAIGSDKEGDGEDMLSDFENRPRPDSEPR